MNQQPDKFFRDKLHNYAPRVSADTWNRIEAARKKGKKPVMWLKAAATILLLAVAGMLLYPWRTPVKQHIAENTKPKEQSQPQTHEAPVSEEIQPADTSTAPAVPRTEKKAPADRQVPPQRQQAAVKKRAPAALDRKPTVTPRETLPPAESHAGDQPAQVSAAHADNITIVFSAEEVNSKYLTKKVLAEATPAEEASSTLKKLLDKAHDLKHNQDFLGDLRQKKNEILALNFKTAKQRN